MSLQQQAALGNGGSHPEGLVHRGLLDDRRAAGERGQEIGHVARQE